MGHREKAGRAYFWKKSSLFNDAWLVVANLENGTKEVIADFETKFAAKRTAKELNHAIEGKIYLVED